MATASIRVGAVVRGLYGALLLARTRDVLVRVHGLRAEPVEVVVLRVLGARHVAQALLTLAVPTGPVVKTGRAADLLHGATAAGLPALGPAYRRAGLVELTVASAFAASGRPS